jgi:Ca-activated chloride channel homolog
MFLFTPEFIDNFHFLRPLLLLALIPALLLVLLLRFLQGNQSSWQQAIDPRLLPYLLDKSVSAQQSWPLYGLLLLWLLGVLALAGPVWEQSPVPVQQREDALVIVLDLSLSMYAEDLRPSRVTRAQRKIVDILNARRREGQTGLVVYAGGAHAVTPMTNDVETINNMVPSLLPNIMPELGSRPALGIQLALELLDNSALPQGHILLLTDGISSSDAAAILQQLSNSGHRLSVIGFGTEAGAPIPIDQQGYLRDSNNAIVIPRLERAPLQQLAAAAGGLYADAQLTDEDIEMLLDNSLFASDEALMEADREYDTWIESGPWLLLLALPLAALGFRRGWVLGLALVAVLTPEHQAWALEWRDLWERKDQQGSAAFGAEDYAAAAERFRDPAWRAAANHRSGNYSAAVQDLALLDDPEAHYNRGNALARLNQLEAALEAYDQTLAQVPDHADALKNREIVEKLLEQQQQEQQQQDSGGDQQQEEQDQQEGEQQDQQSQQQQQEQQQQESQEQQQGEQDQQEQEQQLSEGEQPESEEEQAMQQWLQRIPDDPGELLRNKFRYQSQQRLFQQLQNPVLVNPQTADQIW